MFATLSDVKTHLNIGQVTSDDQKLTNILDMSNEFVEEYTNVRNSVAGTISIDDYLPYPTNRMIVDEQGIKTIDKVLINGVETGTTASIMRGYMVVLSQEVSGMIKLECTTDAVVQKAAKSLKLAVLELVKHYYKNEYKVAIQNGGESIRFDSTNYIPAHIKSILDLYRQ